MRRRKDPNAWFQQAMKVADDSSVSDWLKSSLIDAINRDPLDAARDAEILLSILAQRAEAVTQRGGKQLDAGKAVTKGGD